MSSVIFPVDLDVVTAEDVYGAVIEQFCGLPDARVKEILPVLLENLNFTYIMNKVHNFKIYVYIRMFRILNILLSQFSCFYR